MPNWCMNSLTLKHEDKSKIDDLLATIKEKHGEEFFNLLCPRPADQEENWYDWNINNWGTKWDIGIIDGEIQREDDNTISLTFDTAWSPPIAFDNFLFDEGWDVTAKYYEPGGGFIGEYDNSIDDCWEYSYDDEETIKAIPEELLEWSGLWQDYLDWKESNEEINDDAE